jgi:Na+-transporting methylmalonyl-CoA/oxaloacetate decarboxylase gamma subunit
MTAAYIDRLIDALGDGLALTVVGVAIVFAALVVLMLVVTALNALFGAREASVETPAAAAAAAPVSAPVAPAPVPVEGAARISPRVLAVICAAAAAALGARAQVTRVRFVESGRRGHWTASGRANIMASHRPHLQRRPRPNPPGN